jgi:hypothetical protein
MLDTKQFSTCLIHCRTDYAIAARYMQELQDRHIHVVAVEPTGGLEEAITAFPERTSVIVLCTPRLLKLPRIRELMDRMRQLGKSSGGRIAILTIESMEIPEPLRGITCIRDDFGHPDQGFELILNFVLYPLPAWAQLHCHPSRMRRVTGATWWDEDALVADEYYGHVIRVTRSQSSVILGGLDEPYHIHLDRRDLIISNLGANEVISGRLRSGALWNIRSVRHAAGRSFRRPHGVFQGGGISLIADTDNNRVLRKTGHFHDRRSEWAVLHTPYRYAFPCAVSGGSAGVWIADTFGQRVCGIFSRRKDQCVEIVRDNKGKLTFPVALCEWGKFLFVSTEKAKRLAIFCVERLENGCRTARPPRTDLDLSFIGSPLGIAVNRSSKVLIADRDRGCCWVIDIAAAIGMDVT